MITQFSSWSCEVRPATNLAERHIYEGPQEGLEFWCRSNFPAGTELLVTPIVGGQLARRAYSVST